MTRDVVVAIAPQIDDGLVAAVESAGGRVGVLEKADGLVWTDPINPADLAEALARSPARWVQLPFAGIEEFFAAGVIDEAHTWTCMKGVYGHSTAEHALTLMLAAARRLPAHLRARSWDDKTVGRSERRLHEATVVIVGTGGIGRALSAMLEPLNAAVIGVNRSGRPLRGALETYAREDLLNVLPRADFVVVAAALTRETEGMFDPSAFEAMNEKAWLVNVARGRLVDTDALVEALVTGAIGGAALDVTDPEPLPEGHPLWDLENCIVTPHVANTWDMALPELRALVGRNVERWKRGEELEGMVDPRLGY